MAKLLLEELRASGFVVVLDEAKGAVLHGLGLIKLLTPEEKAALVNMLTPLKPAIIEFLSSDEGKTFFSSETKPCPKT